MNKYVSILLAVLFSHSVIFGQKIIKLGTHKKQNYQLNFEKAKPIIAYWQEIFKEQNIPYDIENYSIEQGKDLETGQSFIYLLGTNNTQTTKVAIELFKEGKKIVLNQKSLERFNIICSGNLNVCTELGRLGGKWICGTQCVESCVKLVSIYVDEKDELSIKSFLKKYK